MYKRQVNIADEPAVDIGCSDSVLLCSVEELSDSAKSVESHAEKTKSTARTSDNMDFLFMSEPPFIIHHRFLDAN